MASTYHAYPYNSSISNAYAPAFCSCEQDRLASFFFVGAFAMHARGRNISVRTWRSWSSPAYHSVYHPKNAVLVLHFIVFQFSCQVDADARLTVFSPETCLLANEFSNLMTSWVLPTYNHPYGALIYIYTGCMYPQLVLTPRSFNF